MARRNKNYKQVDVLTKSLGSAGTAERVARFGKVDAQGISAWLNNVVVTMMSQETEASDMGYMAYLTSSSSDSGFNDTVITARGIAAAGTKSLNAKRYIRENADIVEGNDGYVYLWLEQSDTVLEEEARVCIETWGRFIDVHIY